MKYSAQQNKHIPEGETLADSEEPVLSPFDQKEGELYMKTRSTRFIIIVYGVLLLLGIGTGYLLSHSSIASSLGGSPQIIKTDKVSGSTDSKTFKDSAVGVVQKGGQDGEGTHQLVRDGGPSQTVTLISSVVDLDQYVGKKVKVSGQTLAAKKVAWLMDVGRVETQ